MWTNGVPVLVAAALMAVFGAALMCWWLAGLTQDDISGEHPEAPDSAASRSERWEEPPRSVLVEAWIVPRNHTPSSPAAQARSPESPKSRELCFAWRPVGGPQSRPQ